MLERIRNGRTDLVFDLLARGKPTTSTDSHGVPIIKWCAYYGDVSAIRYLVANGESLESLGNNFDLNGAAFHGHWRLCEYLVENGSDVDHPLPDTHETPLHAALCTPQRMAHDLVVEVLLAHGADPNRATRRSVETGSFMRDCRTRGETPLHRAAAFGTEHTVQALLDSGAKIDARDMNGDSPLTWASWYARSASILRQLCHGEFSIHPDHGLGMQDHLLGKPGSDST